MKAAPAATYSEVVTVEEQKDARKIKGIYLNNLDSA